MTEFRFGPVELYVVGFEGSGPSPGVLGAMVDLIESGVVRLLDLVVIARSADGVVTVTDVEDTSEELGLAQIELFAAGLVGEEDIEEIIELVALGGSAAVVALELTYARTLAEQVARSGGQVLRTERIPAPVVNLVYEAAGEN